VLRSLGAAGGALAVGSGRVAAAGTERFVVDTRGTGAGTVPDDARVVHDLAPIDALVVEGDPEAMNGRYAPDVTLALDLPVESRGLAGTDGVVDSLFDLQWDKRRQRVPRAHEHTAGGDTTVAVIDTGVDPSHPDLRHAVDRERSRNLTGDGGDFRDDRGHGTHVAGIVAGGNRSGRGVLGTAPGTDVMACRVFSGYRAAFGDVLAAMVYSVKAGADVANLSLGAYPLPLVDTDVQVLLDLTGRAAAFGREHGTLFVAAAGNSGRDLDGDGAVANLPSGAPGVMAVSATGPIGFRWDDADDQEEPLDELREPTDTPAFYTNYGREAVDISAPGGNMARESTATGRYHDLVLSSVPGGYGWLAGTSMAAPEVAGAAALVCSADPTATPDEVRELLRRTATEVEAERYHGAGHLATLAAVEAALE
jgi:subtilisin family serine protease